MLDALTPDDAPECARLEAVLFPGDDPWSASAFTSELHAGHPYYAARVADRLVGYAGVALLPAPAFSREPAEAEVHTIGVDPDVQGHGIGRALLRALLGRADAIGAVTFLEVRTDNGPALDLYRSEGFEVVGTRRRYYASGADAYTMRRESTTHRADPR
ncbi:ribosomal protein S18-alanine N-acetyltransferase [Actinomycetospora sp. Odt1-22]|uniref:Ribosomal protein S18-alanine N-acetyltransferase n=1 Tax=Actinomycetospora termitidis TaxID=3053470 RepID=A0ABT7M475_9PSEU|nr:ribosomal protein S18-alanine N-acetyltransferase [Actinomycetospora sp. Odt1-22]MDL5155483.1 ribosomal protein S18-alanine N-acetyltransferase [Actinomycetospora sp. Odt1-22]